MNPEGSRSHGSDFGVGRAGLPSVPVSNDWRKADPGKAKLLNHQDNHCFTETALHLDRTDKTCHIKWMSE